MTSYDTMRNTMEAEARAALLAGAHGPQVVIADVPCRCSEPSDTMENPDRLATDNVNHPDHYNQHPSGVECIDVVEHLTFNVGNAVKYLWRADHKGATIEDLRKAAWYINREIARRTALENQQAAPPMADEPCEMRRRREYS